MYEAPEYWELKRAITHWETVRRYVDLARTFRSMSYGATLTISSTEGQYSRDAAQEVTLTDSLRKEVLDFLAQRYEDAAAKMNENLPAPFDVRRAAQT